MGRQVHESPEPPGLRRCKGMPPPPPACLVIDSSSGRPRHSGQPSAAHRKGRHRRRVAVKHVKHGEHGAPPLPPLHSLRSQQPCQDKFQNKRVHEMPTRLWPKVIGAATAAVQQDEQPPGIRLAARWPLR